MKKLMTAALAVLTLAGGSAALGASAQAAPYHPQQHAQSRVVIKQVYKPAPRKAAHRWQRGQYAPKAYRGRDRQVDYRRYRLRQPPRGYTWVRGDSSNQYLMIALATGLIAAISSH